MTNISEPITAPDYADGIPDPRPALSRALDTAAAVIDRVGTEHLELPTPCDAMSTAELLSHFIMVAERIANGARGDALEAWAMAGPSLDVDAWSSEFRSAASRATAEWAADDTRLERTTQLPWTTLPGVGVVAIYINELVVHTWDLATSIGVDVSWDDEILRIATAAIHRELPDADRGPMWAAIAAHLPDGIEFESPFTNAVDVDPDADAVEQLIAWNGRSPRWSSD